jgi:hypothetical protein
MTITFQRRPQMKKGLQFHLQTDFVLSDYDGFYSEIFSLRKIGIISAYFPLISHWIQVTNQ